MSTRPTNQGRAATPEAEAARRQKIAATLKEKGIKPPVKTAKPKPEVKPTTAPTTPQQALAACYVLPSVLSSVGELAGNPKALELAGKLAEMEKDLKAASSEVGSLRARIAQSDSRVAELLKEKAVVEARLTDTRSQLIAAKIKLENMTEECRLQTESKEWSDAKLIEAMAMLQGTHWTCTHPGDLPGKIEGLKSGWELAVGDTEHLGEQNSALKRECEALRRDRDSLAADLSNLHLAHDQANANVERLQAANEALGNEVDRLIADSPRLPLWARTLGALVALIAVGFVAHRMGFEAHAALTGGVR